MYESDRRYCMGVYKNGRNIFSKPFGDAKDNVYEALKLYTSGVC